MTWPETADVCTDYHKNSTNISLTFHFLKAKTAIVDVYNTCKGDTDIIRHDRISQCKKRERVTTKHYKEL